MILQLVYGFKGCTMANKFSRIGLFAKSDNIEINETLAQVIKFLISKKVQIFIENNAATLLQNTNQLDIKPANKIGKHCDLIIVIGGDGSLLKAGRHIIDSGIPIVGINRGRVGFLADIPPNKLEKHLEEILAGEYQEDDRCVLKTEIIHHEEKISTHYSINDIVLYNGDIARMIEFEVLIDGQFVVNQRSDGIIIATPTGSTAYSLSGGGPILYPTLQAITLVPMFPHTLSSRPIVISDSSRIKLVVPDKKTTIPKISFDGQTHLDLAATDQINISKHTKQLRLLHPKAYNYFAMLREKMGWHNTIGSDR
jgi:NAD+ kinase